MYKILIVDDERNEREGIARLIRKYGYDLEVHLAANGEEALSIFEKVKIDILLTDIQMPLMSGMELISQVNQRGWSPVCIIYSAYGRFDYAQSAIRLGVLQYLLKPINLTEFEKLFQDVFRICKEKEERLNEQKMMEQNLRDEQEEKIARSLLVYLESNENEELEELRELEGAVWTPILFSGYSNIAIKYWENYLEDIHRIFGIENLVVNRGDSQFLLLLKDSELSEKEVTKKCSEVLKLSKSKYFTEMFIVAGNACSTLGELKKEYEQIAEHLDYQFFRSESMFLYNRNGALRKTSDVLSLYFEKILTSAKLSDFKGMREEFQKVFHYVESQEGFSSIYIKYHFSEIVKKCCELLHREETLLQIVEEIYCAQSIQGMKDSVLSLIESLEKNHDQNVEESRLVSKAKQLVQENYRDCTLSVAAIAEELHVSAAYLSALYKMETGQTLIKYISRYRIEKAKELLVTTNYKISDVAERVGYLNTSYFISLFKNTTGDSPAKYREKKL